MQTNMSRRSAIHKVTASAAVIAVASKLSPVLVAKEPAAMKLKGRINHSV
jgi:hypothetical protein